MKEIKNTLVIDYDGVVIIGTGCNKGDTMYVIDFNKMKEGVAIITDIDEDDDNNIEYEFDKFVMGVEK